MGNSCQLLKNAVRGGPPIFPPIFLMKLHTKIWPSTNFQLVICPAALVRIFLMLKNSQKTDIFKKFYRASILTNFNFQKRFYFVCASTFRKKILDST